jgi:hypothetical protein
MLMSLLIEFEFFLILGVLSIRKIFFIFDLLLLLISKNDEDKSNSEELGILEELGLLSKDNFFLVLFPLTFFFSFWRLLAEANFLFFSLVFL